MSSVAYYKEGGTTAHLRLVSGVIDSMMIESAFILTLSAAFPSNSDSEKHT